MPKILEKQLQHAWRLERHYGLIKKSLGARGFRLYGAGFAILFLARALTVIGPAVTLLSALSCASLFTTTKIESDEKIVFYPSIANPSGTIWKIHLHGSVFEPEENSTLRAALISILRPGDLTSPEEKTLYERRARLFMVDNQRWKSVQVELAGRKFVLPASTANGHFEGDIELSQADWQKFARDGKLECRAVLPPGDVRDFRGHVFAMPDNAFIVASDIDDTIKISDVRDKHELLRNTFARPFRATPGVPGFYRRLSNQGAAFFYVSASPWQLYPELVGFLETERYPAGPFLMKYFRLKDADFFNLFMKPFDYKVASIEPLLLTYPRHRFVLIGDSGEKDPEAYAELAKRHPSQIAKIWIRLAYGDEPDRFAKIKAGLAEGVFATFADPSLLVLPGT